MSTYSHRILMSNQILHLIDKSVKLLSSIYCPTANKCNYVEQTIYLNLAVIKEDSILVNTLL